MFTGKPQSLYFEIEVVKIKEMKSNDIRYKFICFVLAPNPQVYVHQKQQKVRFNKFNQSSQEN